MAGTLLLAGYLGAGNHGDDAMAFGFATEMSKRGFECTTLSGNPDETFKHYKMRSYPRKEGRSIDRALAEADALVFPGGSIFQDATSLASVLYYGNLVNKAKAAGKKILLLGQGAGPLNSFLGKRSASAAFNKADLVTVRDPASLQTLQGIGVRGKIHVTADCAFLLPPPLQDDTESFAVGGMRAVGVAARPLGKGIDVANIVGEFCRLMYQSGTMPVLIAMDRTMDFDLNEAISKRQGGSMPNLHKSVTPMQIQARMARMDAVVAFRLHAGILATTVGVPPLMVNYDPKVTAFARMIDLGASIPIENLSPTRMFDTFTAFMKDRDRNVKLIERKRVELANLAMLNVDLAVEALKAS